MEAKELARHSDIRQTAKYTHIGMEDRAEALAGLPRTIASSFADKMYIDCNSDGVLGQEVSASARPVARMEPSKTKKPLRVKGFRRLLTPPVRNWHLA